MRLGGSSSPRMNGAEREAWMGNRTQSGQLLVQELWRLCTKRGRPSICGAVNGRMSIDARPKESKRWVVEETASLGRWRRHVKFLIRGWSRRDKAALCFPKPCISWHFRHRTWVHARAGCLTPARRPLSRSAFLSTALLLRSFASHSPTWLRSNVLNRTCEQPGKTAQGCLALAPFDLVPLPSLI